MKILLNLCLLLTATTLIFGQIQSDYFFEFCGTVYSVKDYQVDSAVQSREDYSPATEYLIQTPEFIVHYATSGQDSTSQEYADSVSVFLNHYYSIFLNDGWNNLPDDCGFGNVNCIPGENPDARFDVYIVGPETLDHPLDDGQPYSYPDFYGRFNPEYDIPDSLGVTGFIEITNSIYLTDVAAENTLRSLIVHELSHAIQNSYAIDECMGHSPCSDNWFNEAAAVFMENQLVYNHMIEDWMNTLGIDSDTPRNLSLGINMWFHGDGASSFKYQYKGALWAQFLTEYYNTTNIIREIFEAYGQFQSYPAEGFGYHMYSAIQNVLTEQPYNSNINVALKNYAIWRYLTTTQHCDESDNSYGHFSNCESLPAANIDNDINTYPIYNYDNDLRGHSCFKLGAAGTSRFDNIDSNYSITLESDADETIEYYYLMLSGGYYESVQTLPSFGNYASNGTTTNTDYTAIQYATVYNWDDQ